MGARLQLRVSPGAGRSAVVGRHGDAWKVRVAARAEDGKANDALVRLLAEALALPAQQVRIVSGHFSRDKTVALEGLERDEMERRLAVASGAGKELPEMSVGLTELTKERRQRLGRRRERK